MSVVTPVVQQWLDRGLSDPEAFWAEAAGQLPWFRRWDQVFEWTYPAFRWFIGAETNLAYNALDRHVANGRGKHPALIYMNERGERRAFSYAELLALVERIAVRAARVRHRQGGSPDDLHADLPGGDRIDARHGQDRGDPLGRVRRLRGQRPGWPHQRERIPPGLRRRRDLSQGKGRRSQDHRGRCAQRLRRFRGARHRAGARRTPGRSAPIARCDVG